MQLIQDLQYIETVESNSRVNIVLNFNNGYSLLVEGSFSIKQNEKLRLGSDEYGRLDFSADYFYKIKSYIETKNIENEYFSEREGNLVLELAEGVVFESYCGEEDYEAWELSRGGKAIVGSECGTIVRYQSVN